MIGRKKLIRKLCKPLKVTHAVNPKSEVVLLG